MAHCCKKTFNVLDILVLQEQECFLRLPVNVHRTVPIPGEFRLEIYSFNLQPFLNSVLTSIVLGRYQGTSDHQVDQEQTGGAQSPGSKQRWQLLTDMDGIRMWPSVLRGGCGCEMNCSELEVRKGSNLLSVHLMLGLSAAIWKSYCSVSMIIITHISQFIGHLRTGTGTVWRK